MTYFFLVRDHNDASNNQFTTIMNKNTLILSVGLALGSLSQVNAANSVYVTGSSAFRGVCYTVLSTPAPSGMWDAAPDIATRGNATASRASQMLFHGNISGVETFVSCFWSGS